MLSRQGYGWTNLVGEDQLPITTWLGIDALRMTGGLYDFSSDPFS